MNTPTRELKPGQIVTWRSGKRTRVGLFLGRDEQGRVQVRVLLADGRTGAIQTLTTEPRGHGTTR
jgi:hypothetical protein